MSGSGHSPLIEHPCESAWQSKPTSLAFGPVLALSRCPPYFPSSGSGGILKILLVAEYLGKGVAGVVTDAALPFIDVMHIRQESLEGRNGVFRSGTELSQPIRGVCADNGILVIKQFRKSGDGFWSHA